ncbi:hypothetical protein ABTY98_16075 [Streptomyces sp. NPDC096040]|uniref:hypothetical protein n=1 Tax=Streptomyces sp. NPDC096040 TaxID=3155541 RepID=UPI0033196979
MTRGPVAGAGATGADCGAHATGTDAGTAAGATAADVTDRWTAGAADGAAGIGALPPLRTAPAPASVVRAAAPPARRPADGTRCTAGAAEPVDPAEAAPLPAARNGTTGTADPRPPAEPVSPAAPVGPANGSACAGRSRPDTAPTPVIPVRPPPVRPALDAPSRTVCERMPMNDGFCQVGSRPPNRESATDPPAASSAR